MGSDYPPKCFLPEVQAEERVHTEVAPSFQDSSGRGLEGRPFPEPELFAFLEAQAWESRREPHIIKISVSRRMGLEGEFLSWEAVRHEG